MISPYELDVELPLLLVELVHNGVLQLTTGRRLNVRGNVAHMRSWKHNAVTA
jgi:hypothetical protein